MQLNLASALKREVLAIACERVARGVSRGDRRTTRLAVGLTPSPGGAKGHRVAVRVPARAGNDTEALLRRLSKHPRDFDITRDITFRPRITLRPGASCAHERVTAGTLGGFVEDHRGIYLLSNSHILAHPKGRAGDPIFQPGPDDCRRGKPRLIARLSRWTALAPGLGTTDSAIARLVNDSDWFHPGWIPGIGTHARLPLDDRLALRGVVKRGCTSGVTRGQVSAFDLDAVEIDYTERPGRSRIIRFEGLIEFVALRSAMPFSKPGDSGSFIIDERTLKPAALLFAGGRGRDGIDRTLGHFMTQVLKEMRVRLAC